MGRRRDPGHLLGSLDWTRRSTKEKGLHQQLRVPVPSVPLEKNTPVSRPYLVVFNRNEGLTHRVAHRVLVRDDELVAGLVQVLRHFLRRRGGE